MSGFLPFFNKRRTFLKQSMGLTALYFLNPLNVFSQSKNEETKMIQLIKKSEQFNDVIFGGRFYANKPVYNGQANSKPYSNLFYWSHAYVNEACEFGLHPHEGFEIMSFLFEGAIEHYDTATRVWTPLKAGDFQIIQSNSGIRHQERITKGSRAFQIWFDPNFYKAIQDVPSYVDYNSEDFQPKKENDITTVTYVGEGSKAVTKTPNLTIKKLIFEEQTSKTLTLDPTSSYTFYVLNGNGSADNLSLEQDDALRISNAKSLDINFKGELFYIQTPIQLDYTPVWA